MSEERTKVAHLSVVARKAERLGVEIGGLGKAVLDEHDARGSGVIGEKRAAISGAPCAWQRAGGST